MNRLCRRSPQYAYSHLCTLQLKTVQISRFDKPINITFHRTFKYIQKHSPNFFISRCAVRRAGLRPSMSTFCEKNFRFLLTAEKLLMETNMETQCPSYFQQVVEYSNWFTHFKIVDTKLIYSSGLGGVFTDLWWFQDFQISWNHFRL